MIDNKYEDPSFGSRLIEWYELNKRDLPWRNTHDPYRIWLSEVILQQTRVNQGMDYYLHMIERFPDVRALAEADEDEVLKYWQGLGYYSRARNLHAAAKEVLDRHDGEMPSSYDSLLKLKGIGEYTAAAIASFSEDSPHPVVDGNVYRFLARYLALSEPINTTKSRKLFTEAAFLLMDKQRPGLFNQAIMEFGALQCTPSLPDCNRCPFEGNCLARQEDKVAKYPVKPEKTKSQIRYFHYFHISLGQDTFISQRMGKDIWHKLYEFPLIETQQPATFEQLQQMEEFKTLFDRSGASRFETRISDKKHILSHRILYVNVYQVEIRQTTEALSRFIRIREDEIEKYPVHRLMAGYIDGRGRK